MTNRRKPLQAHVLFSCWEENGGAGERVSVVRREYAPERARSRRADRRPGAEAAGARVDLPRVRLLRGGRGGITRGQRAPSVRSTSLRTSSSKSPKFKAVSHSSHS